MDRKHEEDSPAARRRQRQHQRIMDEVLQAALELCTAEGMDALTMQRLGQRLGYAPAALYRYFPSKDAIFVALQAQVFEVLDSDLASGSAALEAALASSRRVRDVEAALARIWVLTCGYIKLWQSRPVEVSLLQLSVGHPRELVSTDEAQGVLPVLGRLLGHMERPLREAAAAGALDPGAAPKRAFMLWAALHGVLQSRKLARLGLPGLSSERAAAPIDDLAETLVRTLLVGWGADPAALKRSEQRVAAALPS